MFFRKVLGKKDKPEKGQPPDDNKKPETTISDLKNASKTKTIDRRPQTVQKPNELTVVQSSEIPHKNSTKRLESFADLMGELSDHEETKDSNMKVKTDLTQQMLSAKNVGRIRINNRIGTVLPDAFLGDVMSRREQEIDDLDHNSYFEVQRTTFKEENTPSQQDFMDSFFTKKAESNDQQKPQPNINSEASHNSFEIVDDDSSVTYVPDITAIEKTIGFATSMKQKEDISPVSKEDQILLKSTTPLNDTTTSSEIVKSDQRGDRSQEAGTPSSQSNQKLSSEFVESSNSGSNINSIELQNSSSNTSSELQRTESLTTAIYSDFENRPTAQFVKQEDFIVELNSQKVEQEQIDFVPKVFLPLRQETIQIMGHTIAAVVEKQHEVLYEEVQVVEFEQPADEVGQEQPIEPDSQQEIKPIISESKQPDQQHQQSEQILVQDEKEQLEIGFDPRVVEEVEAPSERLQSIPSSFSFDQNGLPSDTYFDRKRIYETSITEGSYTAPVVQRRVALPNQIKGTTNLDTPDITNGPNQILNTPLQLQTVQDELKQTVPVVQASSIFEKKVPLQQRPVSSGLSLPPQMIIGEVEGFLDRNDNTTKRQAFREPRKDRKQLLIEQMRLAEPEVKEQNSSESNLTDKSFIECASLNSEEIEIALQVQEQRAALEDQYFLNDLSNYQDNINFEAKLETKTEQVVNTEQEQEDFLKILSECEISYKVHNDVKYQDLRKNNSQFLKQTELSLQKVLSDPETIPGGVNKLFGPQEKKTCISVQDGYILIGTNQGNFHAFSKETGILLGTHKEDGKEFMDNPITCIDYHLNRTKYAVIGYQKGQIALIDLTEIKKTVKLIKDHHKKPIVSVKFCDWAKEKLHYTMGKDHKCNDCTDVKAWMFVSIDTDGKVVVNTVTNISFGLLYANDYIINDPTKIPEHLKYEGISAAFSSKRYPSDASTDNSTVVALACSESVVIRILGEKSQEQRMYIKKPSLYPSENQGRYQENKDRLPVLAWGFGKTPMFNFQVFPLLAIGWGPVIQIVVLRDINGDNSQCEDFQLDGYYIISQSTSNDTEQDLSVCSLQFIDESLLVAVTNSGEVRVMVTEKFKESFYSVDPSTSLETLDSRCKYLVNGTALTQKQQEVEMERITRLGTNLESSMYGVGSAQVCSVWMDKLYLLGDDQRVYILKHMKWLENLLVVNQIARESAWIEVFSRALNIYTGRLKGLRIEGETEQAKKEKMRSQLKTFIETLVSQTIAQFRTQTSLTKEAVANNCQLLIRVVIEFSIEIGEPVFLFEALHDQFRRAGLENEFSAEIKPYILSGTFSECIIPEKVLEEGILRNFKNIMMEKPEENLAENFEKILLNLRFDGCSKSYLKQLIGLCHEHKFSTGIIHVSLCCYGEQGPMHALSELRDFYLNLVAHENENKESIKPTFEEIYQVNTLPLASDERARIEQCSAYIGLKLLWTTRYFLLGKKVPRGIFTNNQWHTLCHDVLEFITQPEIIDLFMRIDAAAYFQIVSIAFNNPSTQFTQIEKGRPFQKEPYEALPQNKLQKQAQDNNPPVMTHEIIVKRISSYFQEQDVSNIIGNETSQTRLYYLCFIASICGQYKQSPEEEINGRLYYEVALELLRHSEKLIGFNKSLLQRRMTNKLMYRRLSKAGNAAPDEEKHLVLTEEMLLVLVQKARPELTDQKSLDQILEAVERTNFSDVKLVLYDLNNDYSKCMRLFMSNERQKPTLSVKTNKGEIDGFEWIQNRYQGLETRAHDDSTVSQQLQNFRREIFSQAFYLVKANTVKTIKLCEAIFSSAHLEIIEKMQGEQKWQLVYIQHLIELKREDIKKLISGQTPGSRKAGDFEKWRTILSMHVRLICVVEPSRVTPEIEKIVKDNFYPMEECLKTCFEFKQLEACALIHKKLGQYSEAIELYLKVMANGLNVEQLKKELFYYNKDRQKHIDRERQRLTEENKARLSEDIRKTPDLKLMRLLIQNAIKTAVQISRNDKLQDHYLAWVSKFGKNLELIDRVMDRIQSICRSHPKEVLETKDNEVCMRVLQALFGILFHPSVRRKGYCKRQMKIKIVTFCRSTLEYISFGRLLQVATSNNKNLKYKAIKELVNEVFCDKTQEIEMCMTVQSNAQSDLRFYQNLTIRNKGTGVAFTQDSLTCVICKLSVSELKFKSQLVLHSKTNDLVIFDCNNADQERHACHARCLKKMIQDEIQNDSKKAQLSEKAIIRLFRCPSCNPKNQFVLFSQEKTEEAIEVESVLDPLFDDQEVASAPSSRRTLRLKPSTAEQKLIQKQKNIRKFEETLMMDECLTRGDFRLD